MHEYERARLWTRAMAPYLEQDASYSSDSSGASGDAAARTHANPRGPRSSSYARSSPGSRYVAQEAQGGTLDDGEALVVTDLEDEGGAESPAAGDDHRAAHSGKNGHIDASSEGHSHYDAHSEGSAYHSGHTDEYMWPEDTLAAHRRRGGRGLATSASTHSVDDDDEPEVQLYICCLLLHFAIMLQLYMLASTVCCYATHVIHCHTLLSRCTMLYMMLVAALAAVQAVRVF